MDKLIFYILDVFAEEKYTGNQLAVVMDAGGLSDAEMQKIAQEMNYSETTFILSNEERDGGYDVRIFTPDTELPFAGHPTLGTAYVILHKILGNRDDAVKLNLEVGQIGVTSEGDDLLWMRPQFPEFGETFDPGEIANILSLNKEDIDENFPIQQVSTGFPCMVVPLKSLDALQRAQVKRDEFFELIKDKQAKQILIFSSEPHKPENDLSVRFFADYLGIPEDPATGSANGSLAGYLVHHRYYDADDIYKKVGQGFEMGRPSQLHLRAKKDKDGIHIVVGGKVVMVAKGELV
jgi:trans-2,3-dihydro-3-hydroxyanthranilate isomerase